MDKSVHIITSCGHRSIDSSFKMNKFATYYVAILPIIKKNFIYKR